MKEKYDIALSFAGEVLCGRGPNQEVHNLKFAIPSKKTALVP